ncbi:hypothetical protein ACVL91_000603 [Bradyrhizobium elkanii]|uniref:Uncharacterized protein n=1 Tax=Bradyrhizobium elkanii TaxID=29448 RepID=A0A8I1YBY7_BRAEL|nr:hypothetical protein [Bradyrhizobium elkanii]
MALPFSAKVIREVEKRAGKPACLSRYMRAQNHHRQRDLSLEAKKKRCKINSLQVEKSGFAFPRNEIEQRKRK